MTTRSNTQRRLPRAGRWLPCALAACVAAAAAQTPAPPTGTPRSWAEQAAANERPIVDPDNTAPVRYRIHKIDAKGDTTREVIETRLGNVARLVERNGQPLTPAEDAAEKVRLNAILAAPDDFIRHHKHDEANRSDSLELVRLMPSAMLYTYTIGQPQLPGRSTPQVVLDFTPDPAFHPPTMLSEVLTGLAGRVWIDAASRRVMRIEGRVLKPVNFGWGIVGHVYPGGTVELEQTSVGNDRWVYSLLNTSLSLRVIIKTFPMNDRMAATAFHLLPAPLSLQDAIHTLLAEPIPLRSP